MTDIQTARHGAILTLTMARPKRRNALTLAMYEQMTAALEQAAQDDSVRVVCLRGAEGTFTSGNDLMDFMQHPPTGPESPVFGFLRAVLDFPKPLVAAIQGYAIGIGTTVLLHCDLAYADNTAVFQMPFVNLALVPEAASSLLLPRDIGMRRASELLLLGERFDAARACRDGLINEVWAPEDFERHLQQKLALLASRPPTSMRLSKKLLRDRDREDTYHVMVEEGRYFVERLSSPEFMQVVQEFLKKK